MVRTIFTIACLIGILALFILDRNRKLHTSKALWIPVVWLLIVGSRPLSQWLRTDQSISSLDQVNVEANPINVAVFSVLLTSGLIVLAGRRRQIVKILRANWPIVLFFAYCAISTLWSDYPSAAFRKWIRSLGDPVMVVVVLTDAMPVGALKRLLARTGFVLLPLSVLFIKYYPDLGRAYSNDWEPMYTGVTDNKNTLGMVCLVFGIGFLWRFLEHYRNKSERGRRRRLLADGTILAIVIWLLRMAHSVTSSTCLLMASALIALVEFSSLRRRPAVIHLLVAALVGAPLFVLLFDAGGNVVESVGRTVSLTGRTQIWHQVLGMARDPLFGTGFESFWLGDRFREMWDNNPNARLNEAHDGYIEVYLNLGWCGVALLALLIVTGYRNAMAAFRRDPHIGALKLAYFVAVLVYSLTEAGFRMAAPVWMFYLLAIAAVPWLGPRSRSFGQGPSGLVGANLHLECAQRDS